MSFINASLSLFLEEWLLSCIILLLCFLAGYWIWKQKKKRHHPPEKKGGQQPAASGMNEVPAFPDDTQPAQREQSAPPPERVALLEEALDAALAGDKQASLPSVPEGIPPEIQKRIDKSLKELDAFGLTFQKMRVFNDPNASLQRLTQAITLDIVFSTKVLKQANSPFFGMPGQVSSLHHAVLILGINNLKTLYFQDHFKMIGQEGGHYSTIRQQVWRHSIATAILAAHLCVAFKMAPPETAFTLGLLHDVGKLALADMAEHMVNEQQEHPDYHTGWSVEEEEALFGVEHATIGRMAATSWNLPKETAMVIGAHHHMRLDSEAKTDSAKSLVLSLSLADSLAHALLGEPWRPLPAAVAARLQNKKRMLAALRDPGLHEELDMAKILA